MHSRKRALTSICPSAFLFPSRFFVEFFSSSGKTSPIMNMFTFVSRYLLVVAGLYATIFFPMVFAIKSPKGPVCKPGQMGELAPPQVIENRD